MFLERAKQRKFDKMRIKLCTFARTTLWTNFMYILYDLYVNTFIKNKLKQYFHSVEWLCIATCRVSRLNPNLEEREKVIFVNRVIIANCKGQQLSGHRSGREWFYQFS